jgi:D-arabinose 1-dehydrogenase-like Zn-dependent alcohol dehydrogenase
MKAILLKEFELPLRIESIPDPAPPGAGEVVVDSQYRLEVPREVPRSDQKAEYIVCVGKGWGSLRSHKRVEENP